MRRFAKFTLPISPWLLFLTLASGPGGCSNNGTPAGAKTFMPPKEEKKTPLEAKGRQGILKGKIVYDGEPPVMPFNKGIDEHGDKQGCLQGGPGETHKQTWVVHAETKAVANIVVWLEPPPGKYFSLRDKDKKRPGELVVLDQPHCAFVPHVLALFPSYFDGAKQASTGQKLQIKNSASFLHTVQWDLSRDNDGKSLPLAPNGGKIELVLNPQKNCLAIGCGVHSWMHGILWIFDHPYHAVTREDGSFEIKHVPTEVELTFKAWHESRVNPFEERKLTVKAGENPTLELKIKQ